MVRSRKRRFRGCGGGAYWRRKQEKTRKENGVRTQCLECHVKNVELYPVGNREPLKALEPDCDLHIGKVTLTGYGEQGGGESSVRDTCRECVLVV